MGNSILAISIWIINMDKVYSNGLINRNMKVNGIKGYNMAKEYSLQHVIRSFMVNGILDSWFISIMTSIHKIMKSIEFRLRLQNSYRSIIYRHYLWVRVNKVIIIHSTTLLNCFISWIMKMIRSMWWVHLKSWSWIIHSIMIVQSIMKISKKHWKW